MIQKKINVARAEITSKVFGSFDKNVRRLEDAFGVRIFNRENDSDIGDTILIEGDDLACDKAVGAIKYLIKVANLSESISDQTVDYVIRMTDDGRENELDDLDDDCFCVTAKGKPIKAKTVGQKKYVEAIRKNTVVFGIGPAGTGKTYLAVAMAVKAFRAHQMSRIILTRPAVEAGERLGFLPGDLQSKIDPYLRPLYDALYDMLGAENCSRMLEKMTIEIAPLAYMRGRTLDDSFIILDEAQNTTPEQMKMFLTRLGNGSKAIITGDLTQTDLPRGQRSGLAEAVRILKDIDDISIHEFTDRDVVRHRLVQKIIMAYEKDGRNRMNRTDKERTSYKIKRSEVK